MRKIPQANSDFTAEQLPSTRREMFFDCWKVRFGLLMRIGAICLTFALPLLLFGILRDVGVSSVYAEYSEGNVTAEEAKVMALSAGNLYGLLSVVGYALLSPAFAGSAEVVKRTVWLEPVFFGADFRRGIRSNGVVYAVLFTIFGIFAYFAQYALNVVDDFWLSALPFGVLFVVFLPVFLLMSAQNAVYNVKFSENAKNSLLLYLKTVPKTLAATAVLFLPALLLLIPNLLLRYALLLPVLLFYLPFGILFWLLYAFSLFDKYINAERFPELVGRGLQKK